MVTARVEVEESDRKDKFNFAGFARKFRFRGRSDKNSPVKFSFSKFLRSKKKAPEEPQFESGYGESETFERTFP